MTRSYAVFTPTETRGRHSLNHRGTETQREHRDGRTEKETQRRKEVVADVMRQCRGLTVELPAIERSPATGEKSAGSECEHPSQSDFPPADAPEARRFRLAFFLHGKGGTIHPTAREEEWRGVRSRSAGRWTGQRGRMLAFRDVARSTGPGRRSTTAGTSPRIETSRETLRLSSPLCSFSVPLCLCGSNGWVGGLCVFATSRLCVKSLVGVAFVMPSCLCVFVVIRMDRSDNS